MRKIDQVNRNIQAILKKHNIIPGVGEEAFWEAYDEVHRASASDGARLGELATEWNQINTAMKEQYEGI